VGRQVLINGRPVTVVGIVPERFTGVYTLIEFDAYMPHGMMMPETDYKEEIDRRDNHDLPVLGRLKPGVSVRQAQAAVEVLAAQLERQYPVTNRTVRARVIPERLARPEPHSADSNPFVAGVFLLLVGLVLLVACVNVVNLLLARATVRQRELAVRAALGAGRTRLIRQLLTESLVLAAAGAIAGAALGRWLSAMLASITLPMDLPLRFDLGFDWRVFGYIATIAVGAGIAVGLVPALRASRMDINDALREGGRGLADGSTRHRLRSVLVVCQVAVSLVLLVAAGLFVRSVQRAQSVDLGFHPQRVLNASMDVGQQAYTETRGRAFYRDLEERVRALPGVESVSYAYSVPFGYYNSSEFVEAEGQPIPKDQARPSAGYNMVGPEYFRTMGITIVKGRPFTDQDNQRSRPVAIVNELMAARFWPGQDAIGKRFQPVNRRDLWLEVVGIARNGKYGYIFEDPRLYYFVPIEQQYGPMRALHVRTTGAPELLAPAIEREIRALDPDLPIYDVRPMSRVLDGPNGFFLLQMGALFGAGMGLLGLALAMVGIYGIVSYTAGQRTQEIGVRVALGAQRRDILRLVVGHGLLLVGTGIAIGMVGAFGVARLLKTLLFGIPAADPVTFVMVPLALAAMAGLASFLPAFRATKIDPMLALRNG
jgi:predicted permease